MHDMTRAKCDVHFGDHNTLAADAFHGLEKIRAQAVSLSVR